MTCYRFEKKEYDRGLLDKSVDATYIIHLEGNGRIESVENQLNQFQPSKTVFIVFNKGFKNCEKSSTLKTPAMDLVDAFLTVFGDAKKRHYRNILILEDDFFFDELIRQTDVQKDIAKFIHKKNKKDEEFMYYLGCIPFIQIPSLHSNHSQIALSCGTHACIYSRPLREKLLNQIGTNAIVSDWDIYHNAYTTRYLYYKPLCYQLFPDTENSKEWSKNFFNTGSILSFIFKRLHLDTRVDPGYHYFYIFSVMQFWFYVILFIILIYFLYIFFIKSKSKESKKLLHSFSFSLSLN